MSMRNSKVRKRIAAGKLNLRIRDLRNLGPKSETMLARIGIYTVSALRDRGGLEAFWAMKRADVTSSLNTLWALVGALEPWPEGTDWRDVASGDQRLSLLLALETRENARAAVLEAAGDAGAATARKAATDPKTARTRPQKTRSLLPKKRVPQAD